MIRRKQAEQSIRNSLKEKRLREESDKMRDFFLRNFLETGERFGDARLRELPAYAIFGTQQLRNL